MILSDFFESWVSNLNRTFERIKSQGKKIIQSGSWYGQKYAYFSTENDLKFNACFYEEEDGL